MQKSMCVYVHLKMCMSMHTLVEASSWQSMYFSIAMHLNFVIQHSSLNLELAILARLFGQWTPGTAYVWYPSSVVLGHTQLLHGGWRSKLRSYPMSHLLSLWVGFYKHKILEQQRGKPQKSLFGKSMKGPHGRQGRVDTPGFYGWIMHVLLSKDQAVLFKKDWEENTFISRMLQIQYQKAWG